MRGSPPLQLLIVTLGLLAFAWPLRRLTAERPVQAAAPVAPAGAAVRPGTSAVHATLFVRFAHRPEKVEVLDAHGSLWKAEQPEVSPVEVPLQVVVENDAAELTVRAQWPAGTPETALGLTLEPDGRESRETTVWSAETGLERIVLFQWKTP